MPEVRALRFALARVSTAAPRSAAALSLTGHSLGIGLGCPGRERA
jgi:hypothetical protein